PLGLFLSGGIDSTGLAVLAARLTGGPLRTFAVGFGEREANELAFARQAARAARAEHREVVVTPAEFFGALPRLVWQEDEPIAFTSSVPLNFVSRLAREYVKVVLTGEGADELFLGYNRYRVTHWNQRLSALYRMAAPSPVRRGVQRLVRGLPASLRRYSTRSFLELAPGPRALFFENFALFPDRLRTALLRPGFDTGRDPYAAGLQAYAAASGGS